MEINLNNDPTAREQIQRQRVILNDLPLSDRASSPAIATELKQAINQLKGACYDLETGGVKYHEMKNSDAFAAYCQTAARLKNFDLHTLSSQSERLAFWINIYNALTVHGIAELKVENSVKEIGLGTFFGRVCYQIGQNTFSLDEIEHGILRQNQKKHLFARRPFGSQDPRQAYILPVLEPRIHFTLVCASKSCPPIGTYQAEQLENQMRLAAANFINSENVQIDMNQTSLQISKIFQWYGKDFGKKADLLRFIAEYRQDEREKAYILANLNRLNLKYLPYNWNLNH